MIIKRLYKFITNCCDKYFFSWLNPEYSTRPADIKTFKDFLKDKTNHQLTIKEWFEQKEIKGNPSTMMQHLFAQAAMRYPDFKSKYTALAYARNEEWSNAVNVEKKNGEIPSGCETGRLVACLDSFFRISPIDTGTTVSFAQVNINNLIFTK